MYMNYSLLYLIRSGTLLLAMLVSVSTFSQKIAFSTVRPATTKSLQQANSLRTVLDQLEQKYNVRFNYASQLVEGKQTPVVVPEKSTSLDEALDTLLGPLGLRYEKIYDQIYGIYRMSPKSDRTKSQALQPGMESLYRAHVSLTNRLKGLPVNRPATIDKTITGTVTDENNEPLPGVNVLVKNTTKGTVTNVEGNYRLTAPDDAQTLVFSSVGYLSQEIVLTNQTTVNVSMEPDVQALDEVVVIAYGQTSKKDLTESVSSVKGETLENLPASRLDQTLQGRAAGVNVTSVNGAPGARSTIRIRGGNSISASNEPLYVLDGFIIGTDFDLNTLNINDIESIEILKDATSISIYGSRGANGVILITTKSGKGVGRGSKPSINVNLYSGLQNITRTIDILDGPSLAAYHNETASYLGNPLPFPNIQNITNTNWQNEISQPGSITNLDASFSGNSEYTNYYVSANYFDQKGVIKNSGLERFVFRTNIDTRISDKLTVGTRININRANNENNKTDFFIVLKEAITSIPIFDENGEYTSIHPITTQPFNNPIQVINEEEDNTTGTNIIGNIYAEYEIFEGLKFRSSFGPDIRINQRNRYVPGTIPSRANSDLGGFGRIDKTSFISYLNENTLSYTKDFNENHNLDLLLGFTWQTTDEESSFSEAQGFSTDQLTFNNLAIGDPLRNQVGSNSIERSLVSWLGRLNYNFKDKYYLTAVGRVDGSSVFAAENKYAFFPSVAASWRLDEEPFIEQLDLFSNLKLRASLGRAGSQAIEPYQTLPKLAITNPLFGTSEVFGLAKGAPASDIKWETTDQLDIGLEAGFFNGRLNIEMDYYHKKTRDLLLDVAISPITGFSNQLANFGSIENKGLELSLSSVNIANEDFTWRSNLVISGNRSKVLDIGDSPFLGGVNGRIEVGQPVGVFKGVEYLGTIQTQEQLDNPPADWFFTADADLGFPVLRDTDESGGISIEDYITLGNPEPDFFGGLNNTFKYKGLTLDVFLQYSSGNDIYWDQIANRAFFGDFSANVFSEVANRWTPENPNSDIPRAGSFNSAINTVPSSVYVFDGSFLRLKTLRLAYNFDPDILGLNGLQVYVIGDNLAILTNYPGFDPEVNTAGTNSVVRGQDSAAYPKNWGLTMGINIKF